MKTVIPHAFNRIYTDKEIQASTWPVTYLRLGVNSWVYKKHRYILCRSEKRREAASCSWRFLGSSPGMKSGCRWVNTPSPSLHLGDLTVNVKKVTKHAHLRANTQHNTSQQGRSSTQSWDLQLCVLKGPPYFIHPLPSQKCYALTWIPGYTVYPSHT